MRIRFTTLIKIIVVLWVAPKLLLAFSVIGRNKNILILALVGIILWLGYNKRYVKDRN